jgi:hypothetical protein
MSARCQEGIGQGVEFLGVTHVNIVLSFREDMQPRSGDAAMDHLGMKNRHQRVPRAMQHQGRAPYLVQPLAVEIAAGLEQGHLPVHITIP